MKGEFENEEQAATVPTTAFLLLFDGVKFLPGPRQRGFEQFFKELREAEEAEEKEKKRKEEEAAAAAALEQEEGKMESEE